MTDPVNAAISAARGNWAEAGINLAATVPVIGDAIKGVDKAVDVTKAAKAFSSEKAALVAMAKADKMSGISKADMKAYKDLNRGLKDPFPASKVRGPEAHPRAGAQSSRQPHGHVGPVNHIPINKPEPRVCTGTRICP